MELTEYLTEIVMVIIMFFGGLAWNTFRKWAKDNFDIDFARFLDEDALHTALDAGVRSTLRTYGKNKKLKGIEFENEVVRQALRWMYYEFPDKLNKAEYTPEQLEAWLRAKYFSELPYNHQDD